VSVAAASGGRSRNEEGPSLRMALPLSASVYAEEPHASRQAKQTCLPATIQVLETVEGI
jgi:hypothetical protein